tara:strand:- start:301 stop:447 length:147 start_codon:yes stop_codon:yes gene_type:complete
LIIELHGLKKYYRKQIKKTLDSMTPVKQELVLGYFALAIAAAFISANR